MKEKHDKIDRRNFLKTIGAMGLGSVLASSQLKADPNEPNEVQKTEEQKFPELPEENSVRPVSKFRFCLTA